jgi:hypothetical protein
MPLWGNTDTTGNSVISAPAQLHQAPNTSNRDALYGNTTANGYGTSETVGMYGVSVAEMAASGDTSVGSITISAAGTGYTARPTVTVAVPDAVNGVRATATLVGKVVTVALNGPGTGGSAIPGDTLTTAGGTGTQATINVTATEIRTVAIAVAGSGYTNGNVITATVGTGTKATYTVTTGAADTIPASLALTTRGSYTANPGLSAAVTTAAPPGGTGLTVDHTTRVKTVAIKTAGAWTVLPTLTGNSPTGGGATGVTLNLTIGAGAATMGLNGSGYATVPDLTFGGAGGSATAGVAVLSASQGSGINHAGWQLRTQGQGGRAGRVRWETLVAMSSISGDATDDTVLPE